MPNLEMIPLEERSEYGRHVLKATELHLETLGFLRRMELMEGTP